MPACRIPPPSIFRTRRASAMKSFGPQSMAPTGAPSPLERQNVTVSVSAHISGAETPEAATALKSRAPSMCSASFRARANALISFRNARG